MTELAEENNDHYSEKEKALISQVYAISKKQVEQGQVYTGEEILTYIRACARNPSP